MSLLFAMWRGGKKRRAAITIDTPTLVENIAAFSPIATLSVVNGSGTYDFDIEDDPSGFFDLDGDHFEQVVASASADFDYEEATSHTVTFSADNGVDPPILRDITFTVTNDVADDVLPPEPPLLSIDSGTTDTTPNFNVDLPINYGDYRDAAVGDDLVIRRNTDPETAWSTHVTRTLIADDLAGVPVALTGITPLSNGDYLFDAHLERSGVESDSSPTVAHTIGPFDPAELFANGEKGFWIDFQDLSTLFQESTAVTPVSASGQNIGYAADKSGNGNHFIQATAGNRPFYMVNSSIASMHGNGNSNRYLKCAGINLDSATDVTMIVAHLNRRNGTTGSFYELVSETSAGANPSLRTQIAFASPPGLRFYAVAPNNKWYEYTWTEIDSVNSVDYFANVFTIEHRCGGTSVHNTMRKNGVSVGGPIVQANNTTNFGTNLYGHINSVANGAGAAQSTRMAAIICVNRLLTSVERGDVEAYMAAKIGVTLP
jgi:hypothetical protein